MPISSVSIGCCTDYTVAGKCTVDGKDNKEDKTREEADMTKRLLLTYLLLILSVTDCHAISLIRQARNCVQKSKANDRLRHQRSVQRADKLCAFVAKRPREEAWNFNSPSPTVPTAVEKGCKSFSQVGT